VADKVSRDDTMVPKRCRTAYDCIIIGGGPAGLTAAIYLARFHLRTLVIDAGNSRAAGIPLTRNHAGYPEGISGKDLLFRMRMQAESFGTDLIVGTARQILKERENFLVQTEERTFSSRAVLLATGVTNRRPDMPLQLHDAALAAGLLRYCPICDGFEVTDKRIAVLGNGERGAREALFLRSYSADVTLISLAPDADIPAMLQSQLDAADIVQFKGPPQAIMTDDREVLIATAEETWRFDTLYPALGSDIHSDLAAALGARVSDEGCLVVDRHQRTNITGLYGAGDVVLGLDQISHAIGEGGVAATTIRNDLCHGKSAWRKSPSQCEP
jgi:thioredoxin reductase (NADPH)